MQVEYRGVHTPVCLRTALLCVGAALLIIVGLLGMHTLSADSGSHGAAVSTHLTHAVDLPHPLAASTAEGHASSCDEACMNGSAGGHSGMDTACILALLAGLLILLRPLLGRRLGPQPHLLTSRLRLNIGRTLNRAPSLTFLSISRT